MRLPTVMGEFRCGKDPELRFTPSGQATCSLRAVATARRKTETGEWVDGDSSWVNLVGWQRVAENMAESFGKGDLVVVVGKLKVREWEASDGRTGISVDIVVDHIGPSVAWDPARKVASDRQERQQQGGRRQQAADPSNDPWAVSNQGDEPPF